MRDTTIEEQTELIELIQDAGFEVDSIETTEHSYAIRTEDDCIRTTFEIRITSIETKETENPFRVK